jgi:CDGSH-type Zn-finger protein/uncharacterized Fe-S cluster protein YjdI
MTDKIRTYWSDEIVVTYDAGRCIHAAECVRGLPGVFDTGKRPWIQPENASADEIAEVVMRCPTGALHFERKDGAAAEPASDTNTIRVRERGPLVLRGAIELRLADGTVVRDTRMALCRCGASENKPFCDNSHGRAGFAGTGELGENKVRVLDTIQTGGKLIVTPTPDGSIKVEGDLRLASADGETDYEGNRAFLCRCGGSHNKPFCDGTHKTIGFEAAGL